MAHLPKNPGAGQAQTAWPALLLILVGVLTPTVCVLWFMSQAVRNEQSAVQWQFSRAYQSRLIDIQKRIDAYWNAKVAALAPATTRPAAAGETFARLVSSGAADSVIVYGPDGRVAYPNETPPASADEFEETADFSDAARLEFELDRPLDAAAAYARIAAQSADVAAQARARLAEARCLAKGGNTDAAVSMLTVTLGDDKYRRATDAGGRLIQCSARLFALQLLKDPSRPEFRAAADALVRQVTDYSDLSLPAGQRELAMTQLRTMLPNGPTFPTLDAETLAAQYLEDNPPPPKAPCVTPSPRGDWCLASPDKRILAIYRGPRAAEAMQSLIDAANPLCDVAIALRPRSTLGPRNSGFLVDSAGTYLPGWDLVLDLNGPDPFAAAAHRRVMIHAWTAGLGILIIASLGAVLGWFVSRQVRLSRLKNDLVATVSHELKTPLASMRMLIDTLREGRCRDAGQASEYYDLIARENERLTRLIDHFLTFSRMERNKRQFEFAGVEPGQIVTAAVEAMHDRLSPPQCVLDVEIAADLPTILGDRDALITVVLNLLDNAHKYSAPPRRIAVRAYAADGDVRIEVKDNGVGLSRRAARKIFDRFYQVDQTLSRGTGGCGLGLSIVKFIVEAHGGSVTVESELGRGSTFTVKLPVSANP